MLCYTKKNQPMFCIFEFYCFQVIDDILNVVIQANFLYKCNL
jgi:hypothetical protein